MKKLHLHIGTHKTGSTSLQQYLQDHSQLLQDQGYEFYQGWHIPENHIELYLAAMRSDRDSFGRQSQKKVISSEDYFPRVRQKVHEFFDCCEQPNVIPSFLEQLSVSVREPHLIGSDKYKLNKTL